jgi:uncharacterized protein (DUF362 family)/NAD-dependent dihydropyrimidine dehydrogenase PreA subunit
VAKVSLTSCSTYDPPRVEAAVRQLLEPLGGMGAFIEPGQRVLVKPNLLMPVRPERAITTHPSVVEAVIRLVQEQKADPFIAESPGGPLHNNIGMRRVYRDTGMQEVAERTGASLHYDSAAVQVAAPGEGLLKRLDLMRAWKEADAVIALPKLKTHGKTTITGGVKVLFGLVPGLTKTAYHAKLERLDDFCDMLLDIVALVQPALYVMDGIVALEGNGPSLGGTPRDGRVLLASADGIALDAALCRLIGLDPAPLALFRAAARRGWWPKEIDFAGAPPEQLEMKAFRLPESAGGDGVMARGRFSRWWLEASTPLPVPSPERCTGCGTCVQSCPRDAIEVVERLAVVNAKACIRCYCCHEMCPEGAIDLEVSRAGRILRRTGVLGRYN